MRPVHISQRLNSLAKCNTGKFSMRWVLHLGIEKARLFFNDLPWVTVVLMAANVWSGPSWSGKERIFCRAPPSYREGFVAPRCSAPLCSFDPETARVDRSSGLFQGCLQGIREARIPYRRCMLHTRVDERHVKLNQVVDQDHRSTRHHKKVAFAVCYGDQALYVCVCPYSIMA